MPRARKHIVRLSATPYYHVTSRCVRRAFLCGVDDFSGKSYEHRRSWIEDRVRVLSSLFSIELCAYAIMSNHYHLVVKINSEEPQSWSNDEVLSRWTALFRGPVLVQRYRDGSAMSPVELDTLNSIVRVYRARLGNLSWFMKCLNEPIARRANAEDGCTGHFWEARFNSQPLCSQRALLAVMAYVDLNPIRASAAKTPEESSYTSIRARLRGDDRDDMLRGAASGMLRRKELRHFDAPFRRLMPFADEVDNTEGVALPILRNEYFNLVDTTGRIVQRGKRGRIDSSLVPILDRLQFSSEDWIQASSAFGQHYREGDLKIKKTA